MLNGDELVDRFDSSHAIPRDYWDPRTSDIWSPCRALAVCVVGCDRRYPTDLGDFGSYEGTSLYMCISGTTYQNRVIQSANGIYFERALQ